VSKLRKAAKDQSCVRCGLCNGTTVLAHYTGPRRGAYGGGMGKKVHDAIGAHLCADCHRYMDSEAKDKEHRWELSEQMLHYCALTLIRLFDQGVVK
jgi:hypothetical protein